MVKKEENIAENVVKGLKIGANDVLLIDTNERMLHTANDIAFAARRLGAETHTRIITEEMWLRSITELPVEWLRSPDRLLQNAMKVVTAWVYMGGIGDPTKYKKISPERWEANSVGAEESVKEWKEMKIRGLDLPLGIITTQRAKAYGLDFKEWKKSVMDAISADYDKIAYEAKKLAPVIENSRTVHITGNKTNLTFELAKRKTRIYDGMVDDEDISLGNLNASLPDGAIAVAPKEGTAEGDITFDIPIPAYGKLIQGLRWTLKDGSLADYDAEKNLDLFEMTLKNVEKSEYGKRLGAFMIGLNPKAKLGFLQNNIARGATTIGLGNNEELGGDNKKGMGIWETLGKGTVAIDGKEIVKNGKIVV
jgi:leucyl aminopeptidase (aminopeptidase T)